MIEALQLMPSPSISCLQVLGLLGGDVLWGLLKAVQGCCEGLLLAVDLILVARLVHSVCTGLAELRVGVDGVVVLGVGILTMH